jgi:cyclophilin family peptidyl-prolyl cis-trans isomerase
MRKLARNFWNLVRGGRQARRTRKPVTAHRWRPRFEPLEDRFMPATAGFMNATPGVITGLVFVNLSNSQPFQTGDTVLPGVGVNLTGTTSQGQAINVSTTTDANGVFTFFQVPTGTYSLTEGATGNFSSGKGIAGSLGGQSSANGVSLIAVAEGQTGANYDLGVRGLVAEAITARFFLSTPIGSVSSLFASPGPGSAAADGTVQPSGTATAGIAALAGAVMGANQAGMSGVQVSLTGIDDTGRAVIMSTTSGANGAYQFTGLQAGVYTLNVTGTPAGFRAGSPTVGSLGGLTFRNDQITGITVDSGASGTGYNFTEIALPAPTSSGGPPLTAALADDTAGPGGTASDGVTSDPTIVGSVGTGSVTSLQAGFDATPAANFTSVLAELTSTGTFLLNTALLAQINGGALANGPHTLHLLTADAQGQVSAFDVVFNLVTTPPTVPTLHLDTASDPAQIGRTTSTTVTVLGQTSPGVSVALTHGGTTQTTTASASGAFSFSNIILVPGGNFFTVQATDAVGNTSQLNTFFVRQSPPGVVPSSPVKAYVGQNQPDQLIDLSSPQIFTDPNASNTMLRINTSSGPINVELLDSQAPQTVANFLNYVNSGQFINDIFHRLDTNPPVLQGGGFTFNPATHLIDSVTAGPPVPNEFSTTNLDVVGTIAMAKPGSGQNGLSSQNAATSEFFFNTGDNSTTLNASNNGGFTVFAKVASGMDQRILNTLAALPVKDESAFNSAFNVIPLPNYSGTNFPFDTTLANYASISSVQVVQQVDRLSFSVVSNSNAGIVTATINQGQLDLHPTGTGTGTATIVVQATNEGGQTATVTFSVTVGPISLANPGPETNNEGDSVNLTVAGSGGTSALRYSATGLPSGLTINSSSGLISGTIDTGAADSSPYTTIVTATDGTNSASQTFNWTVFTG